MSDAQAPASGWRVFTAAATGAAHRDSERGYEDAVEVYPRTYRERAESVVSVAVADGHGHARHFRSARGSRLAVELAVAKGAELGAMIGSLKTRDAIEQALIAKAGNELLPAWRAAVAEDLRAEPPSGDQLTAAGYPLDADTDQLVYAYGATMILTVAVPGWLLCAQIGDGDVLAVTETGAVIRPIASDPNLDGIRTTSLCQPDALSAMRYGVAALAGARVAAVMLATDGYGNAQVRNDWDSALAADLAALTAAHGPDWVREQLQRWVDQCASSQGSADDVTVALMFVTDPRWSPEPYQPAAATWTPPAARLSEATVPITGVLPGGPAVPVDGPTVRVSTGPIATVADLAVPAVGPATNLASPASRAAGPTAQNSGPKAQNSGPTPQTSGPAAPTSGLAMRADSTNVSSSVPYRPAAYTVKTVWYMAEVVLLSAVIAASIALMFVLILK